MLIIRLLRTLLSLYSLMLLLHFALPYIAASQQPWMAVIARLCEPGVRLGNRLAARLLPDRRFKADMGPLAAALLCWVCRLVLGLFV